MKIHQAILEVQRKVTHVEKGDQYNGGQTRFAYRGVDRVVSALAPAMREVGLLMLPHEVVTSDYQQVQTAGGKTASLARVVVNYLLLCDGDSLTVQAPGEAMDSGDKAVSKAMSVAWRTALIQVFNLPTGEPDPDSEVFDVSQPATTRSEAAMKRTAEYDAAVSAWLDLINETPKGRGEYLSLYNRAVVEGAPKEIIKKILDDGRELT